MKTEDYNGCQQEGFGAMHMTVKNGRRWSTANAYLKPALQRPNLKVITGALSQRILLDGRRATGVEFSRDGKPLGEPGRQDRIESRGGFHESCVGRRVEAGGRLKLPSICVILPQKGS